MILLLFFYCFINKKQQNIYISNREIKFRFNPIGIGAGTWFRTGFVFDALTRLQVLSVFS
jgi:hypothetical protein